MQETVSMATSRLLRSSLQKWSWTKPCPLMFPHHWGAGCSSVRSVAELSGVDPIVLKLYLDALRGSQ